MAGLSPLTGAAQSVDDAYLFVETNALEATIYLDSTQLGMAGTGVWSIQPGKYRLKAAPSGVYSWSFEPETTLINASSGDTLRVTFNFPYTYSISSSPPDANVFHVHGRERKKLGVTPLTHTAERPLEGTLVINKQEFDSVHVAPGVELWNSHRVELVGKGRSGAERHVALPTRERRRTWITYAAAGLAVTAGSAAVYFQRRANNLRSSDDPHVRLRSSKFEQLSSGSLVAMQVGVGVLAVRLVLDN